MVKKFQNYIEQGSWEEDIERQFDLLGWFCWAVIVIATIYFGSAFLHLLMREVPR